MKNGNNTTGEIHIVLDTTDVGDSATGITNDLKIWLGGNSMGEDDEPTVWLVVNDSRDRYQRTTNGMTDCMFSVSVKRLRHICDMIDAMHKVGNDQFDADEEETP
tara:strand:+ start:2870 stop:3184 length:315 start_codon:yes stop_codon:yes gene_type:complete